MSKRRALNHDGPSIGLEAALRLKVTPEHTTRSCPANEFAELVAIATLTAKNPLACVEALQGYDFSEPVYKWHALETLLEHGATIPTFTKEKVSA